MKVGDLMEDLIGKNTKEIYEEEMKPLLTIKICAPGEKKEEEEEKYSLKNPKKKKKKKEDK